MRLLLIADPMIPVPPLHYGGIERIIDMLCREFTRLGHEVCLVAHPDSRTNAKLVPLPGLSPASRIDIVKNMWVIARETRRFRPDLVHSFGRLAQLLPLLPLKLPKIMSYQREPHVVGIARAARLAKTGSLLFTGCSDYITDQIKAVGPAATVYNGVPLRNFDFCPSVGDDAPLVFLGRIERIKGVHNAIEIANLSGRRLLIAGNIPEESEHREYFRSCVEPNLNDRVRYIGPVNDSQKNELLRDALALVMAIEWNEPFGIVMAEAFACGTPILGTPRGAVPEVVTDGLNGFVRLTNHELADCVNKVTPSHRTAARLQCEQRFTDEVIANAYLGIYSKQIG